MVRREMLLKYSTRPSISGHVLLVVPAMGIARMEIDVHGNQWQYDPRTRMFYDVTEGVTHGSEGNHADPSQTAGHPGP